MPHRSSLLLLLLPTLVAASGSAQARAIVDHVPIAVRSLDEGRRTYEALGFRLKAGRLHANGIRNVFAKLRAGDQIELITPERGATDPMTAAYSRFLAEGEGGAYLSLRADSLSRLARRLEAAGVEATLSRYASAFATLTLGEPSLSWLFFIEYLTPVVDPPSLLDHPNSALGIETVWLSDPSRAAFESLGRLVTADGVERAPSPGPHPGAAVVGLTLRVRSVEAARRAVLTGAGLDLPVRADGRGRSVLVPAERAHGVWIEFLEPRSPDGR